MINFVSGQLSPAYIIKAGLFYRRSVIFYTLLKIGTYNLSQISIY